MLLRTFIKTGEHHAASDFDKLDSMPSSEIALHTWLDAPLRELTELLKEHSEAARDHTARLSFAQVYPDKQGDSKFRQVGSVHSVQRGADDAKTLEELNFQAGDYLDVAILPPPPAGGSSTAVAAS